MRLAVFTADLHVLGVRRGIQDAGLAPGADQGETV